MHRSFCFCALTAFALSLMLSAESAAQVDSCQICRTALQQNFKSVKLSETEFLYWLDIQDEASWRQISAGGSAGVEFPIDGVPIGGNATYQQFEAFRSSRFTEKRYTRDARKAFELLSRQTPERAYESFDKCVALCLRKPGVYAWPFVATDKTVILNLHYVPGEGNETNGIPPLTISGSSLRGGKVESVEPGLLFPKPTFFSTPRLAPNRLTAIHIDREPASGALRPEITGTVKFVGSSSDATFHVPEWRPVAVAAPVAAPSMSCENYRASLPVAAQDTVICYGQEVGYYWELGDRLTPWPNWGWNPVGAGPFCNADEIKRTPRAVTGRYYTDESWAGLFLDILPSEQLAGGKTRPVQKDLTRAELWAPSLGPRTGVFRLLCKEIPKR